MGIKTYNILLYFFFPFIIIFFFLRVLLGKEDKNRFLEKIGFISKIRPMGKLVWIHACSVGEVKSSYNLIKYFVKDNYKVLVTTNTYLSSLDVEKNFSENVVHQYLPLDISFFIKKFLKYWRPRKVILIESEIWPNVIYLANKLNIPLFLLQARFSANSIKKWSVFESFFKNILEKFSLIIPQSSLDRKKLKKYTTSAMNIVANLKFSSDILRFSLREKNNLLKHLEKRLIITAVSTHKGEENIIINQIKNLITKKNVLLIIQPRHPYRNKNIISLLKKQNLLFKQRSKKEFPNSNTKIFLFDTFGETGLLMSVSDIVIIGGTLVSIGGHNPIEAAQFGKCIVVGPNVNKIEEIVNDFLEHRAIKKVQKKEHLDQAIKQLINDKKYSQILSSNAKELTLKYLNTALLIYKRIESIK